VIGSREIAAGAEPAHRNGKAACERHIGGMAGQHTRAIRRNIQAALGGRRQVEECAGRRDALGAVCGGKEPLMADAVEALGQNVQQEAPDELVRMKSHHRRD
jgi:hypothetical protein